MSLQVYPVAGDSTVKKVRYQKPLDDAKGRSGSTVPNTLRAYLKM